MDKSFYIKTVAIGVVGGVINGLLGVGGGTFLIPAMVAWLGVHQHQAHGTSLSVTLPTALISVFIYTTNHIYNFDLAYKIALGGVIGGYLGAKIMEKMPALLLRRIFGVCLILTAIRMVF